MTHGGHRRVFPQVGLRPGNGQGLCDAYDRASKSLHDNGQPDIVKEVIARRIISLAQKGKRDPDRLCARALAALGDKAEFKK